MVIIAISGFPKSYALKQVYILLKPIIGFPFEVLQFDPKQTKPKTCYVKLSEDDNPMKVSYRIRGLKIGPYKLFSFIPTDMPKLPLGKKKQFNIQQNYNFKSPVPKITRKVPMKVKKPKPNYPIEKVIAYTHEQILIELQSKYSGLYELNKKTGNSLLPAIGQTIHRRLKETLRDEGSETCMKLSRSYRRVFPHSTDFQLISTTLYRIQDEMGDERIQIQEKDLLADMKSYDSDNISPAPSQPTSDKYLEKISTAIKEHLNNLSTEIDPSRDVNEESARVKVRNQLKIMTPYITGIVKSVVLKHFVSEKNMGCVIKIYGEPCLPSRSMLYAWMKRYKIASMTRSDRMYNLALAQIPAREMSAALAGDGTVIGQSKIVLRPASTSYVKVSISNS